ncbi:hypothetical protein P152DRAFT_6573 [Eremomyces bilateralis CBS 781.70]|uniref:Secreted protein n=1 Tax=Eremomyces bilateralis CBS 781.70 TaxID=1392243 RepID=A0A6G1GGK8_9PEZI|nr:uncharacterized protein P152DRAFT_6573 [Eremomyces bilateralis CBS 781.70]KAF1817041.1 hypothetical protein P152DRAFT_6573 [Eremomyces bilateralis CBS 781.70]
MHVPSLHISLALFAFPFIPGHPVSIATTFEADHEVTLSIYVSLTREGWTDDEPITMTFIAVDNDANCPTIVPETLCLATAQRSIKAGTHCSALSEPWESVFHRFSKLRSRFSARALLGSSSVFFDKRLAIFIF